MSVIEPSTISAAKAKGVLRFSAPSAAVTDCEIDAGSVAMTSGGRTGRDVEIYLYDLTPGGAGFVRAAVEMVASDFKGVSAP